VILPRPARERLTTPVRQALSEPTRPIGNWHTLPVHRHVWAAVSEELVAVVKDFEARCLSASVGPDTYVATRDRLRQLLEQRNRVRSVVLALQPFEPFDKSVAERLVTTIDATLLELTQAIDDGQPFRQSRNALDKICKDWPSEAGHDDEHGLLRTVFGIEDEPLDEEGEFSPSRVLAAYKYDNGHLLQQLLPHLASLGLCPVDDVLAMLCAPGWITAAHEPIVAVTALDRWLSRLLSPVADASSVHEALEHLRRMEPALRQSRQRINRAGLALEAEKDLEHRAIVLADLYKRLVEGPVRQYAWALHCITHGIWRDPPMLTPLREGLIADGGWLATVAASVLLTDLRNGEAHETLTWDGYERRYLVDSTPVDYDRAVAATIIADSFVRGSEAALSYYQALHARPTSELPRPTESGRLPAWRRAEAFFGTNGLRVTRAQFNAATAVIRIERLDNEDINPCFQALLCARRLLPAIEAFEIRCAASPDPMIRVSAEALDLTDPVWITAVGSFWVMPLSTFLPANLNARGHLESESTAVRSVAWIAGGDFLDALDSTPDPWDEAGLWTFVRRVGVVRAALQQCSAAVPDGSRLRVHALLEAVRDVESELEMLAAPITFETIDRLPSTQRIRHFWRVWGPVARLPNITSRRSPGDRDTAFRPTLRTQDWQDLRWRTL
jgi:hypothetical protein